MSEGSNLFKMMNAYAAFGRGDINGAMEHVADDIVWVIPGPAHLPTTGTVNGMEAVKQWFGMLVHTVEYQRFEPYEFIAQGDKVVALLHIEGTVRKTTSRVHTEAAHVWTFRDGKLAHFQVFDDTAAIADAHAE
jgi:uncharacterized protein